MKSKKAAILFSIILVIFLVAILLFAWSLLSSKYKVFDKNIGQRQYELINVYQAAEKSLFYIDQSAKYTLQQSIYDLATSGGYYNEPSCGTFKGVNTWATIERGTTQLKIKECYPSDENVKQNFLKFFDETISRYLANHPDIYIPASYNYELSGNIEIIGKATENLVIDIVPQGFVVKPKQLATTDTREIYKQALNQEIPQILRVAMKSNPDIETIKLYHPEVWNQYVELCKRMNAVNLIGNPSGACASTPTKCCITSGYRHPAYNKEIGGAVNSPHQYGVALDIYVGKDVREQLKWADVADELFTRVGIYPSQADIHVDLMPPKGEFQTTYWIGYKGKTIATANSLNQLEAEAKRRGFV